jgi:hypothetical protein
MSPQQGIAYMKKVAALVTVVAGFAATAVVGAGTALAAPSACASASVQVSVNGSDVVNQAAAQCAP